MTKTPRNLPELFLSLRCKRTVVVVRPPVRVAGESYTMTNQI
jgi:hypothetical protein